MILKFINGKNRELSQLKNVIDYVRDSAKTKPELMGGYCCDKEYPFKDMSAFKQLYNKASGKQYEHFVVSFDPKDDISDEDALSVISEIARINGNHQAFYALHTNTPHLHAHIVMNSVGGDGTKFRQWKPQLRDFKDRVNAICYKNDIESVKGTIGSKPVDDLDLLEFSEEELISGGFSMNYNYFDRNEFYAPMEAENYPIMESDYGHDGSNYIDIFDEPISNRKQVSIGDTYNIVAPSASEAISIVQACKNMDRATSQKVKETKYIFGYRVDYRIGNQFNVVVSKDGIPKSSPTFQDMDMIDINDFDIYPPDDEI